MITWILSATAFLVGFIVAKSFTKSNGVRMGNFHCYQEEGRLWVFTYGRRSMEVEAKDHQSLVIEEGEIEPVES